MVSSTQWTWVWVNLGSWWWTGRPGTLQSMGLQRVVQVWETELNWTEAFHELVHVKFLTLDTYPIKLDITIIMGASQWLSGKESAYQCRRPGFHLWVEKIPCRRKWQPIPVFLPGKSHGWWSLPAIVHGVTESRHILMTKQHKLLLWLLCNKKITYNWRDN